MDQESRPLKDFLPGSTVDQEEAKKEFVDVFVAYAKAVSQSPAEKYKLRLALFQMKYIGGISGATYTGKCKQTSRHPSCFEHCARVKTCVSDHFFHIQYVFQNIVNNGGVFKCKQCKIKQASHLDQIELDYFSYLYHAASSGNEIHMLFNRQKHTQVDQDIRSQVEQTETDVIVVTGAPGTNVTQIVRVSITGSYLIYSNTLKLPQNRELDQVDRHFREYKSSNNNQAQDALGANPIDNSVTSVNVISLITGKRLIDGIMHRDCKHPKNVYIFDFNAIVLGLWQHRSSNSNSQSTIVPVSFNSVRCIYCASEFTKENLREKAIFFGKINEILSFEPVHHGTVYYEAGVKKVCQEQQVIGYYKKLVEMYPKIEPNQIQNALADMKMRSMGFWNKQRVKLYNTQFLKLQDAVTSEFLKEINYKQTFYPVRCTQCKTMDFTDLWVEIFHFSELEMRFTEGKNKCFVCKTQYSDGDSIESKKFYLDYAVFRLMQFKLKHIKYSPVVRAWVPDLQRLRFAENVHWNPLDFMTSYLTGNQQSPPREELLYYQKNFIKKEKYHDKTMRCFILKACNVEGVDSISHVIVLAASSYEYHCLKCQNQANATDREAQKRGGINTPNGFRCPKCQDEISEKERQIQQKMRLDILQDFKCPQCPQKATTIMDILYDVHLTEALRKQQCQWNLARKMFQKYRKIRIVVENVNTLTTISARFKDLLPKKLHQLPQRVNVDAWNTNEIEYGGGVSIFNQAFVQKFVRAA